MRKISISRWPLASLIALFCFSFNANAQLQSWFDNKYSMFIHFGLYSQPGGVWQGKQIPNYSEQIQAHGGIYSDYYNDLTLSFNPEKWDATEVVRLAKRNGMRSIVFTTKHHDGFCMYNSAHTTFDIVDATPYKKDVLKSLAEACKAEGINLGLYFSLIDWTLHPITAMNINSITADHHKYNMQQIEELLSNYGTISELWFDMGSMNEAQSKEMYALVHRLQPDCMVSGRLGNNAYDFCVMADNEYPNYSMVRPWQTAASVYAETWGYRSWQEYSPVDEKVAEKVHTFTHVISRGGNFLLNIGPKGDGSVVKHEEEVLDGIGTWIERNKEAVYGVKANPFGNLTFAWGDIVTKGNNAYLYLNGDKSTTFELPVSKSLIRNASILGSKAKVKTSSNGNSTRITLPSNAYEQLVPVVKLELKSSANLKPVHATLKETLSYKNAENNYSFACIDYYTTHRSVISQTWKWNATKIPVIAYPTSEAGKELRATLNGKELNIKLDPKDHITVSPRIKVTEATYTQPKSDEFQWKEERMNKHPFAKLESANARQIDMNLARPTRLQTTSFVKYQIESEGKQMMQMDIDVENGLMVFHNGKEVIKNLKSGKQVVLVELENGANEVIVKLLNKNQNTTQKVNISIPESFTICKQALDIKADNSTKTLTVEGFEKLDYPQNLHQPSNTNNLFIEI